MGRMQRLDRQRHCAARAYSIRSPMASSTCVRAAAISFEAVLPGREYCGNPPAQHIHGAPSAGLIDAAVVIAHLVRCPGPT
jgi:hypothetical protein